MDHPARTAGRRGANATVASFAFLITVAITVQAQTPPPQPTDITNSERVRQQEMSKREWQLRNLGIAPRNAANDPKHIHAISDQIDQDFKRILTLHNEFARRLAAGKPLDYDFVSDAAGEIKKRASRLQTTLAFLKAGGEEQNQERRSAIKETRVTDALIVLCRHIEGFINNPIIVTPGTIDVQQLSKARRDLEGIIEVSDNLRKVADKLRKTEH